ncbi:hypothetical protein CERZMDRAFT_122376 [Cercospora zeae-maydis SCOH1-5]|uniref:Uncharacterized protein n=1 Tax=Cercospora zeae-maydis SCOH1-5 TaxID=717836 RepID=A0A6A6F3I4_9PEZI|nr:hypothetical protein CERZMDRAFT_122376 [Cercospora zeae-maydis SCOH1-5]
MNTPLNFFIPISERSTPSLLLRMDRVLGVTSPDISNFHMISFHGKSSIGVGVHVTQRHLSSMLLRHDTITDRVLLPRRYQYFAQRVIDRPTEN